MDPGVGSGDILEQLLTFVFAAQIERAYRKGLYRRYRTYECNDSKVKGKIDITRHIRLNPLNNGKIAYSYREYTADNDVNKMIFTAYTYLQKRHPNIMKNLEKKRKTVGECITQFRNIMQPASRQEAQKLVQRERRKITRKSSNMSTGQQKSPHFQRGLSGSCKNNKCIKNQDFLYLLGHSF